MAGGVTGLIANRARVGYMDRQLRRLPRQPRNVGQLGRRLQEIWEQLPQDSLAHLVSSMRRRCSAVINANGGAILFID